MEAEKETWVIVKERKWYDPEGLDIPSPTDVVFKGNSVADCKMKLGAMFEKALEEYPNHKCGLYASMPRWDTLELYWMHAQDKEIFRIRRLG